MTEYLDTVGVLARAASVTKQTVLNYANAGLLEYVLTSDGRRLFKTGQVEKIRQIYASNVKRRGNRRERMSVNS
jgi:DNA-binding transcriptional MerR regulator